MNATYPLVIKIQKRHLEEFVQCEMGAHEDEMTGPSEFTTATILERHENKIECKNAKEAAQIFECTQYGTFPQFHENVAGRINNELRQYQEIVDIWADYNKEQWRALEDVVSESKPKE